MLITNLKILNFRNYNYQELELSSTINIFYGDNAQGKTNILESIYISSIGKSFRTNKDKELINLNRKFSNIEVKYKKSDREGKVKIELSDKKNIFVNGVKINKLSELLGTINIVKFTPEDINILKDGPVQRRKFLDMMIGQLKPNYIYSLNMYNKSLEQRNNYIKQPSNKISNEMIELWDQNLANYAEKIYEYRKEFIEKIKNKITEIHSSITENKEKIKIEYKSDCISKEEYLKALYNARNIDLKKGYTTKGIHRDDFFVYINDTEVKSFGSQGQNRTAVLSLKLAELQVIRDEIGENPILLLDDFMSELDEKRRKNFLYYIKDTQIIITCTDKIELSDDTNYKIFKVSKGEISQNIKS